MLRTMRSNVDEILWMRETRRKGGGDCRDHKGTGRRVVVAGGRRGGERGVKGDCMGKR